MISHFQGVFVLDGEKFADFSLARAKYSEKSRLSTLQLIKVIRVDPEGFDLPQRGRMPLTLPWKGRCPTLNSDVGRMSCISSASRLVLWFFRKYIF